MSKIRKMIFVSNILKLACSFVVDAALQSFSLFVDVCKDVCKDVRGDTNPIPFLSGVKYIVYTLRQIIL